MRRVFPQRLIRDFNLFLSASSALPLNAWPAKYISADFRLGRVQTASGPGEKAKTLEQYPTVLFRNFVLNEIKRAVFSYSWFDHCPWYLHLIKRISRRCWTPLDSVFLTANQR